VGDPDDAPVARTGEHLGGDLLGRRMVEVSDGLVEDEHPLA